MKALLSIIRRLHSEGEPLNISAVKRNHPVLLDGAFAIRPFLGWKGLLGVAGISYSDIRVELTEFVACRICGKEVYAIANHALYIHGHSKGDYAREFPDAELVSDLGKTKVSRFSRQQILPHWEPFWTLEYILDRLFALHTELDYPLTYSVVATVDAGLANAVPGLRGGGNPEHQQNTREKGEGLHGPRRLSATTRRYPMPFIQDGVKAGGSDTGERGTMVEGIPKD